MKTRSTDLIILLSLVFVFSCEQERLAPELTTAQGGGTLSNYKAYTLDSVDGTGLNVYGRAVFWEGNDGNTLLQISLNNTPEQEVLLATIFGGSSTAPEAERMALYSVDGSTGEFTVSKFYVIAEDSFFESLSTYDAFIQISLGDNPVAVGDIGLNSTPVESSE